MTRRLRSGPGVLAGSTVAVLTLAAGLPPGTVGVGPARAQRSPAQHRPAQHHPAQRAPESAGAERRRLYLVVHTRHDRGRVFCALWRGRDGYPTQHERAVAEALDRTIEHGEAVCLFEDLPPGEYAAAVFHDENANNDLDTNVFGIPSEGTGATNDAINAFGPPSYDDARFRYAARTPTQRLDVRIHY